MITGLAHAAICVPDVEAAARWYVDVLGGRLLSPPYRMEGEAIERDMGELVPPPVVVVAAIVGIGGDGDHVLELVEYPSADVRARERTGVTVAGITHVGLLCDDIVATRAQLIERGVEFLTEGFAEVAGLRTTWFRDPWGAVFILMEKGRPDRAYYRQFGG